MNINAIADETYTYLKTKYSRVYRNNATPSPTFPYVVFRVESVTNSYPSEDLYINIDVYEKAGISVRVIEDLADTIDTGLNRKIITTNKVNAHFEREARQYVPTQDLVDAHMINLRYAVRTYFK
jgi:hypothetical protein